MRRVLLWMAAAVALVGVTACGGGASDVALVETPYTDAPSGFQVKFPEDWWVQGEPGLIVAASEESMLRGQASLNLNNLDGQLIVFRVASMAELGIGAPRSADTLIDDLKAAASGDASLEFKRTRNALFGDVGGRYAEFEGTLNESGQMVHGRIYAVIGPQAAATIIAASPEAQWAAFRPVLDAIVGSVNVEGVEE